jgi:hypothetical protein
VSVVGAKSCKNAVGEGSYALVSLRVEAEVDFAIGSDRANEAFAALADFEGR